MASEVPGSRSVFPPLQALEAGETPQPGCADDYNLGDMVLGVEYIFQHCGEEEDFYDVLTVSGNGAAPHPRHRERLATCRLRPRCRPPTG